jgi:hypothetical protein
VRNSIVLISDPPGQESHYSGEALLLVHINLHAHTEVRQARGRARRQRGLSRSRGHTVTSPPEPVAGSRSARRPCFQFSAKTRCAPWEGCKRDCAQSRDRQVHLHCDCGKAPFGDPLELDCAATAVSARRVPIAAAARADAPRSRSSSGSHSLRGRARALVARSAAAASTRERGGTCRLWPRSSTAVRSEARRRFGAAMFRVRRPALLAQATHHHVGALEAAKVRAQQVIARTRALAPASTVRCRPSQRACVRSRWLLQEDFLYN